MEDGERLMGGRWREVDGWKMERLMKPSLLCRPHPVAVTCECALELLSMHRPQLEEGEGKRKAVH